MTEIRISAAMARQKFHGCESGYIRDICHASCCLSSVDPSGVLIAIHPREQRAIEVRGGMVVNGLLQPRGDRCPFHGDGLLCSLHGTTDKPFGCVLSPFTINASGTLIIRNRYRLLKCYGQGRAAYQVFFPSLVLLFGPEGAARVREHLDREGGDLVLKADPVACQMALDNDKIKHGGTLQLEFL